MIIMDERRGMLTLDDGREMQLAPGEWLMLRLLVTQSPNCVTSRALAQDMGMVRTGWDGGGHMHSEDHVRTNVWRLRRKLGRDVILANPGWGYYVPEGRVKLHER